MPAISLHPYGEQNVHQAGIQILWYLGLITMATEATARMVKLAAPSSLNSRNFLPISISVDRCYSCHEDAAENMLMVSSIPPCSNMM